MGSLQVLALLQRLINALGQASPCTYPLVLPVLDYCLDVHGPEALNLVEDALLLWLVTLRNAPSGALDALQLWPRWQAIMGASIEHVPACMQIATSCILLGGVQFLQVRSLYFVRSITWFQCNANGPTPSQTRWVCRRTGRRWRRCWRR